MLIDGYEQGADITLMNTMYVYPKKTTTFDEKKMVAVDEWDKGSITLIYKDNTTGKKYNQYIENPDYEFYFAKDLNIPNNELFISKDKVTKISVPFIELEKKIAELTGNLDFYYNNNKAGNRYANKALHLATNVFMSDTHIEDHYRFRFSQEYQNNICPISKAYLDIEVDNKYIRGDFPEPGEAPINAVTIVDEAKNKVFTFLLKDKNNPLIDKFQSQLSHDTFKELKDFIRNAVGGWKNEIRFGLDKFEYNILFYDFNEEINMISDLFKYINSSQPDFILAWNMSFDIPYIIERIKVLGYDPKDIMCHPDFQNKQCDYYIDERNKNEFAERGDYAIISSYSVFLDQMIHFASRRKGQSQFTSFSLDFIGSTVAGIHKLDYKDITTDLAELPYLDYKTFVFYNIMDTIVQKCIEKKVGDIDYIFGKCLMNNTRYHKGHRQTVYLTNRGAVEFLKEGFIIGNNVNKFNEKPETKFPGAFVGDPTKVSDYAKMRVGDQIFMLFDNLDDFDYTALYPSILREFNMAPNTQIGMVEIPNQIFENENPYGDEKFSRGGKFLEDLQSQVYLEFCKRWLRMGGYLELYNDIIEYYTAKKDSINQIKLTTPDGYIIPFRIMTNDTFIPFTKVSEDKTRIPFNKCVIRTTKEK